MASVLVDSFLLFFFNDTATTEIYTLSLHDALPILAAASRQQPHPSRRISAARAHGQADAAKPSANSTKDRKSTRLNSSHGYISYAVFCLKKKTKSRPARRPQHPSDPREGLRNVGLL